MSVAIGLLAATEIDKPASEDSGFGALRTEKGCLPLQALAVQAKIAGLDAHVTVRQTFRNVLAEPLEATYIFPLPDRAAVTSFRLAVADRIIEGELKERGAARAEYRLAIESGHRAAIAEEERSGTFSLRVGNLPPQESAMIELVLALPLPVTAGEATFRFPLVVAPRYVPGLPLDGPSVGKGVQPDTDQAPDASRVTPPVLLPGFPNPVALSLEVALEPECLALGSAGLVNQLRSSLHTVVIDEGTPIRLRVQPGERLNRDFILRFPVAATTMKTLLRCTPGPAGKPGVFALTVLPPRSMPTAPRPRALVFVLDRSGSMGGWKMVAARRALGRMVDSLLEQDRFTILAFDTIQEFLPGANAGLVAANDRERWRALEWLGGIDARGGTEMGPALEAAVRLLAQTGDTERTIVLVTDGQVAGEDVLLRTLASAAGGRMPRIHTLGIDQAVNAGFLHKLADAGGGRCELVESEDRLDEVMDQIHRTIGAPVLTQLALDSRRFEPVPGSLVPARLPDVFADRPMTVYGRYLGAPQALRIHISGRDAAGALWEQELLAHPKDDPALLSLWGRAQVRALEDRYAARTDGDAEALAKRIVAVSLEAHVLSRFTAYVAVDRSAIVNPGGQVQEIVQPVELPAGWDNAAAGLAVACYAMPAAASCDAALDSGLALGAFAPPQSSARGVAREARMRKALRPHPSDIAPAPPRSTPGLFGRVLAAGEALVKAVRAGNRYKELKRLVELLEAALAAAHLAADSLEAKAAQALVQQAKERLQAYDAGRKEALTGKDYDRFIETVQQQLALLAGQSVPRPDAGTFWK